jgi:hypothetical protein
MNFLTWRAGSDKHINSDHVTWLADIGSSLGSLIYTPAQSARWRRFPLRDVTADRRERFENHGKSS